LLLNPDQPAAGLERAASESPHEVAERHELGALIQRGLATLPHEQRLTLVLIDIEGLSYEEAADALGTNLGTIKSRLSRARAALRDFLVQHRELVPAQYRLKSERV
ncbi:MAG: sigma-70 family RNA polymerase sigma factor, partial [Anaerolineae bacterium]|nr:sigma-70 family RNA polymerase sigma factor [Anaerolineae bacterium]